LERSTAKLIGFFPDYDLLNWILIAGALQVQETSALIDLLLKTEVKEKLRLPDLRRVATGFQTASIFNLIYAARE